MTVQEIYDYLNALAPFDTAEEWDNVGLLVGSPTDEVRRVLVALDATPAAVDAAVAVGADLIITHHPVIFSPLKTLDKNTVPYRLAQAGISVICAHTNLDKAPDGVNDTLADLLGLTDIYPTPDGMCRIGTLPEVVKADSFAQNVAAALTCTVRVNGGGDIRTVAVCGGSGGDFIEALAGTVDAFVTGEVRHHEWLAAGAAELTVVEAGHYATEVPVVDTLCRWLNEHFPALTVTPYYDGEPYACRKV